MQVLARHPVAVAAAAAVLLRLPALTRPIRADEAGFLLVARSWDPQPDSMFGHYWVDRPPLLIAVFRSLDLLGGQTALRLAGALACGLTVALAAQVARLVGTPRAVPWAAVLTAALLANPMIDVVTVKGELLALPAVLASILLTLLGVRRNAPGLLLASGLLAATALGLKQNIGTGLAFAAALLLVSRRSGRLAGRDTARLAGAGLVGAAVPVLATFAWAGAEGVRASTLWYAVYGFRSDAARVIAEGSTDAPERRAWILLGIALGCGLLFVLGGLLAHLRHLWLDDPPVVAAATAVVATDLAALVASGSYWRAYLLTLVPGAVLCTALLVNLGSWPSRVMRTLVLASAGSALAAMAFWLVYNATGQQEFDEAHTGEAVSAAAHPGDTLAVFGGRADLQMASGLDSPYPYLWSLPMRTRDAGYAHLRRLLAGPDAPTWLVEWVDFGTWGDPGAPGLERVVEERYAAHGEGCGGRPVYLLRGVERAPLEPAC